VVASEDGLLQGKSSEELPSALMPFDSLLAGQ